MKKYQSFLSKNFQFLEVKFSIYLNRRVFVMLENRVLLCILGDSGMRYKLGLRCVYSPVN